MQGVQRKTAAVSSSWVAKDRGPLARRSLNWIGLSLAGLGIFAAASNPVEAEATRAPVSSEELFTLTNVWTIHLTFSADQWKALEPEGGASPFGGGGRGSPGGQGGLGGPGGFRPPGGGFPGPGMFIAPMFTAAGDGDRDGKLSVGEFSALGGKWFGAWDTNQSGGLSLEEIRAGLNASAAPPPGAGAGGPGGPGGRMPGLNLQGAEGRRNGLASAMGIEFPSVRADLEFEGQKFPSVAVRYKGNGTFLQSRSSLKRSLKIDLNDGSPGRKLAGVTKLNLHNCITDASWMNEVLSHRLFRDAGVPAPRTAYARVFLTVPGEFDHEYLGLFSIVENVDGAFLGERFGSKRGALFKPVTPRLFEDLGDAWAAYRQTYDPKSEVGAAETGRVIAFSKLVSSANDAEFAEKLESFLDLEEFARFMAVTVWVCTLDSILGPGQNYLMYLDPTGGRFQFIPWDLDHSFGQFPLIGSQENRENLSLLQPWQGEHRFLERVFKVPAFKERYLARMKELSETVFQPERIQRQVDEVAAAIRPAVREESAQKLARFDKVVAGEPVGPEGIGGFGGGTRPRGPLAGGPRPTDGSAEPPAADVARSVPASFGPPGGGGPGGFMFGQPVKPIKGFVTARSKSVNDQLAGRSEGQTLGSGFGPGGGPPGGRGGGPGGPGGPAGFGPGMFLGQPFLEALDKDKDATVTRAEFTGGMDQWFRSWNADGSGVLTDEQLRAGIDRDLAPFRGGFPGFGPPRGEGGPPRGPE